MVDKCVYCGCKESLYLEIDHKIPKCKGGKDTTDNRQICCILCNRLKSGLSEEQFKAKMKAYRMMTAARVGHLSIPVKWKTLQA